MKKNKVEEMMKVFHWGALCEQLVTVLRTPWLWTSFWVVSHSLIKVENLLKITTIRFDVVYSRVESTSTVLVLSVTTNVAVPHSQQSLSIFLSSLVGSYIVFIWRNIFFFISSQKMTKSFEINSVQLMYSVSRSFIFVSKPSKEFGEGNWKQSPLTP